MTRAFFTPRLLAAAVLVAAVLVPAACGSSSDSGSSGSGLFSGSPSPGQTSTTPTAVPPAAKVAVSIANFAFAPATLTVKAGTTVTWTNKDTAPHDVTSTDGPAVDAAITTSFASGLMDQGKTFSYTFDKTGTYYYECSIHATMPTMHATVVVN